MAQRHEGSTQVLGVRPPGRVSHIPPHRKGREKPWSPSLLSPPADIPSMKYVKS